MFNLTQSLWKLAKTAKTMLFFGFLLRVDLEIMLTFSIEKMLANLEWTNHMRIDPEVHLLFQSRHSAHQNRNFMFRLIIVVVPKHLLPWPVSMVPNSFKSKNELLFSSHSDSGKGVRSAALSQIKVKIKSNIL